MPPLTPAERRHYRDEFRAARYAALADSESFSEICFALEAFGIRLLGELGDIGAYKERISEVAQRSPVFDGLSQKPGAQFKSFKALYEIVKNARNDAMHTGAYARHATEAAIELCIGLEEALMADGTRTVEDLMVKSPITVEPWQPVAHARQIMLTHSFSFLPVRINGAWSLVSELGLAKFLSTNKYARLGMTIEEAHQELVISAELLSRKQLVDDVLRSAKIKDGPTLWLVVDEEHEGYLAGVLSPFELM